MFPEKIVAVVYKSRKDSERVAEQLKAWAESHSMDAHLLGFTEELPFTPDENCLAVSLGGDGTFLRTSRLVAETKTPVLGVNVGSLGFLTQTSSDHIIHALDQVLAGQFRIEDRMRLQINTGTSRFTALNEVVLSRLDVDDFTEVDLYWNAEWISRYPGDGVMIATPSGSTGYSLAAYGPILYPSVDSILITPLNVHVLGLRPVILPSEASLTAVMRFAGHLVIDGMKSLSLSAGEKIEISKAKQTTRIVIPERHPHFFDLMAEKLNWGVRPDEENGVL